MLTIILIVIAVILFAILVAWWTIVEYCTDFDYTDYKIEKIVNLNSCGDEISVKYRCNVAYKNIIWKKYKIMYVADNIEDVIFYLRKQIAKKIVEPVNIDICES